MAKVVLGRFTAQLEGDFVVFVIGMRIHKRCAGNRFARTARQRLGREETGHRMP
ncbi:hypothetical protein ACFQI7_26080 [Paenibacillus allorhizosphaerae]|uniref:Uncharacterized protein n=1 Tax=Paenibacillus allorhizosphaerae TaxID=2849866 RepID=A0ABN7TLL3_9BACL|nr:hypothetical protein [Paenibacillus allorhizosphaerae]CAG7645745.1 hypothetical protein PAECIP111802_03593 [Paenibacillus allorhizosphaerae]